MIVEFVPIKQIVTTSPSGATEERTSFNLLAINSPCCFIFLECLQTRLRHTIKQSCYNPVKPGQPICLFCSIPIRPLNPSAETINVFAFIALDVLSKRLNVNGQNMQFSRYIFAQLLRTTCAVTLVIIGIVWLFQTIRLLEMVISQGAAFSDFLLMSFAVIPLWLTIALPIGAFVAVNWVFHRILNDRELTVMQAIGLSPMQIARAPIALGALVSAAMLANSIFILPSSFGVYKEQQSNPQQHSRNFSSRQCVC